MRKQAIPALLLWAATSASAQNIDAPTQPPATYAALMALEVPVTAGTSATGLIGWSPR